MNWIEITIVTTSAGIEPVCGNLYQLGITGLQIEDEQDFKDFLKNNHQFWDYVDDDLIKEKEKQTCIKAYVSDNASGNEMLLSIKQAMETLKKYDINDEYGELSIFLGNLSEEDWANNWKKYFHPMNVGNKILIKPEWEELKEPTDRLVFNINPGMTFGTGSHYTTQLCIEELENYIDNTKIVLDLGCGSGILSIISLMLSAKSALAVDIDPNCIDIAYKNAERNGVNTDNYEVISGNILEDENICDYISKDKYDVVLANIVADVIIAALPLVKKCINDDGIFITSGIIEDRINDVQNALTESGFEIIRTNQRKDWAAIVAKLKR